MNRQFINVMATVTIMFGALVLRPSPLQAEEGGTCCTSGNGQAQCCGWHCEATMTTCDACTRFWNCPLT